jgi:NAD+ synthetase
MKIHLAQAKPIVGNVKSNFEKILKEVQIASENEADLVCFPELFLAGYPIEDRLFFEDFKLEIENAIQNITLESYKYSKILIALPTPLFENNKCFNSILIIKNGQILKRINKIYLPNYGVFDEKRYFTSGENIDIVEINEKRILFAICEDAWEKEYVSRVKPLNPNLVIVINASPFERGKFEKRISKMKAFKCECIYLNQVLGYDELVFDGYSFGLDANGELKFLMDAFKEQSLTLVAGVKHSVMKYNEIEITYKALVFGLQEYCSQANVSSVILGLSGGIDSALCCKIAIDALGKDNVMPVFLPSSISSEESRKDANEFLHLNHLKAYEVPIKEMLQSATNTLGNLKSLTVQNLQSRIRGIILMSLSNELGKMVITTGNKSELAIGYCTIYGDMNGGFNPIKDLFKTDVFELCHFLNSQKPIFPENILTKSPTAELEAGQTDEASFGIPYSILDFVLKKIIEEKISFKSIENDILKNGMFDKVCDFRKKNGLENLNAEQIVKYIFNLLQKAQFKRSQAVCGTKISSCAFGRDWRFGVKM